MLLDRRNTEERSPEPCSVRQVSPGDVKPLREMFARCSVNAIYERFHSPYPVVPGWMADLMVGVDTGEAFVAVAGGEIVGHAMYVPDGNAAEVAVLIEDAWQSRGVGARLLSVAAESATRRGVETFVCETLAENRRVPGLASAVFSEVERVVRGGTALVRVQLRSLKPGRNVR